MSEQMPSPNISYYLDVPWLIPLIYLRFQKIPSLVSPARFVPGIIPVTLSLSSHFLEISSVYLVIDCLALCVRVSVKYFAFPLIITSAINVNNLHLLTSTAVNHDL